MCAMASVPPKDESSFVMIPDDADHSILQQPLNHGVKNVKQILKCIESGSREVKDIILNECNVIYECKVCLSLFRSLANLLYHKRGFCKKHLCEDMLLFESFNEVDSTVVVQPEPVPNEKAVEDVAVHEELNMEVSKETDNTVSENGFLEPMDNGVLEPMDPPNTDSVLENSEKEDMDDPKTLVEEELINVDDDECKEEVVTLNEEDKSSSRCEVAEANSVVEVLHEPDEKPELKDAKPETIPDQIAEKTVPQKSSNTSIKTKELVPIILKPIPGNRSAVFQVINSQKFSPCSVQLRDAGISTSTIELKKTLEENKVIIVVPKQHKINSVTNCTNENLNSDKPKDIHLTRRKRLLNRSDCNVQKLRCLKCETNFTTLKTLYFHMMSFHSQKRMYFPCPFCKSLFVQMYGVTRHLIQIHGKTKEQINNRMRDAIRKTAVWKRVDHTNACDETNEALEKENDHKDMSLQEEEEKNQSDAPGTNSTKNRLLHSYVRVENNVTLHHCSKCERVFSRKSSQVSHEKFCIMNAPYRAESTDYVTVQPEPPPPTIDDNTSEFEKKSPFEIRLSVRPKRGAEKQMHKDFVDSQTLKWRSANKIGMVKAVSTPTAATGAKKKSVKVHEKRIMSLVNAEKLMCLKCDRKFSSYSNLRRHAAIHIGWTRFKCKCCEYQSYNKSDCIHHVQRMHSPVLEEDLPKYVIHLIPDLSQNKTLSNSKVTKSPKSPDPEPKKSVSGRRKKAFTRKIHIDKRKSQSPSPLKSKVSKCDAKIVYQKSPPVDCKRRKSIKTRTQSKTEPTITRKLPNSYRSVTTNSPTTIILSKTCSNSVVQTSSTSTAASADADKGPIRVSPRKFEPNKVIKNCIATTPEAGTTIVNRKTGFVKIKVSAEPSVVKANDATPDKKKNRPISDWFVKKSPESKAMLIPRRDTGPVIIDLFPASSSTPSRSKNT